VRVAEQLLGVFETGAAQELDDVQVAVGVAENVRVAAGPDGGCVTLQGCRFDATSGVTCRLPA
jgi:hypothetical protein